MRDGVIVAIKRWEVNYTKQKAPRYSNSALKERC